jgi:hypothetical protein
MLGKNCKNANKAMSKAQQLALFNPAGQINQIPVSCENAIAPFELSAENLFALSWRSS